MSSKILEKLSKHVDPNRVVLNHFQAKRVPAVGDISSNQTATRAGPGGASPPEDVGREVSRRTAAGRARIGLAKAEAAATVAHRFFNFSGNFRPTHTSLPLFLDPLNSFPWSLFANSSPFESYDENKVG